jgi:DNA-binding Lrp family transcriptional regulator
MAMVSSSWTFLSNHAHVLLCLARDAESRLRDVAVEVGITERAVLKIVRELEDGGFLTRERMGRRNRYVIHRDVRLRHPVEAHRTVGDLIAMVVKRGG